MHAHLVILIKGQDLFPWPVTLWLPEMMVIASEQEFKLSSPNILLLKAGEKTRVGEIAKYHSSRKTWRREAEWKNITYGEQYRVSKISTVRNLVISWAILASCIKKKCQSNTELFQELLMSNCFFKGQLRLIREGKENEKHNSNFRLWQTGSAKKRAH